MADIQAYLDAIENAVYGEDVRGSIHDAIEIINDVGEKVITAGTAITSPSSSVEGFFEDSLYFNTNTDDLWQCTGTGWSLLGNLKGSQGNPGNPGQAATIAVGTVTKGDNASVVNSGTSSAAVFDFVLPKGDPGPAGVNTWGSITGDIDDQTDLKNAFGDVYAQSEELVDRTVGWVCNNLFDIEAVEMGKDIYGEAAANAALFTLNCKPSTRYYLSVHGTNNLQVSYNTTALGPTEVLIASFPYDFLTTEYDTYIKICFTKSGLTRSDIEALKFLISEVANAPYSEYHPPVSEWGYTREEARVLGAKNLLPMNLSALKSDTENTGTWTGNVYNKSNVDFTLNDDLSVTVNTSGASADTQLVLSFDMVAGDYKLNGCADGSGSTYWIDVYNSKWSGRQYNYNGDTDVTFTGTTKRVFRVFVKSGATVSNKTVYPMLRLASDADDTYAPPAMTNRELTEWTTQNETAVELETGITKWTENVVCKQGKVCFMNLTISGTFTANTEVLVGTIPANYRPRQILFFPLCTTSGYGYAKVGQDGTIRVNNIPANATNLGVFGSWLVP